MSKSVDPMTRMTKMDDDLPWHLALKIPLVILSLKATGSHPRADRVIEIACIKLSVNGSQITMIHRLNPQRGISPEATKLHTISDIDVMDCPIFAEVAPELQNFLTGCNLAGYGLESFDLPLLICEFKRVNLVFPPESVNLLDIRAIFNKFEPPFSLETAYSHFCHQELPIPRSAVTDAIAATNILLAQTSRYKELRTDVQALYEFMHPKRPEVADIPINSRAAAGSTSIAPGNLRTQPYLREAGSTPSRLISTGNLPRDSVSLDPDGRIIWRNGEAILTFGKYKDRSIEAVAEQQPEYLRWMASRGGSGGFSPTVVRIVNSALRGDLPDSLEGFFIALEDLFRDQGKLAEAEQMYKRARSGYEKVLGPDHTSTLNTVNNLGNLFRDQGKLAEAEQMYKQALSGYERVLGPDHTSTLNTVNNLGNLVRDQGKLAEAAVIMREVLQKMERILGYEHPNTLSAMNNLANTLGDQGNLEEAVVIKREVLEKMRRILGYEHPNTLSAMNNLANTLGDQGKLDEAVVIIREVLEKMERILGHEHPNTILAMSNLASVIGDQGKLEEAASIQRKVLGSRRRILGEQHPSTILAENNLANTLHNQGMIAESSSIQRGVVEKMQRIFGEEHPVTISTVNNLASTLREQGCLEEAELMIKEVLQKRIRIFGNEHSSIIMPMNNLARILCDLGKIDEAESIMKEQLKLTAKVLGEDHPDTISAIIELANVLSDQGKFDEVETLLRKRLYDQERRFGPDHVLVYETLYHLGRLYLRQLEPVNEEGNSGSIARTIQNPIREPKLQRCLVEASGILERALRGFERLFGPDDERTLSAMDASLVILAHIPSERPCPVLFKPEQIIDETTQTASSDSLRKGAEMLINIKMMLEDCLPIGQQGDLNIDVSWDFPEFVKQECLNGQSIASIVVLVADGDNIRAMTCSHYLQMQWPQLDISILEFFAIAATSEQGSQSTRVAGVRIFMEWQESCNSAPSLSYAKLSFSGTSTMIMELVCFVTWLVAAMRRSSWAQVSSSTANLEKLREPNEANFRLRPNELSLVTKSNSSCWQCLFSHRVITSGYTILSPPLGLGVEMPYELMTELSGAKCPAKFNGRPLLVGDYTALVPTPGFSGDMVQWHILTFSGQNNASIQGLLYEYTTILDDQYSTSESFVDFVSLLSSRRHYLGWCRNATVTLGANPRQGGRYTINGFTRTPEIRRTATLTSVNGGIGSSGFGFAGPTIAGTYTISHNRKNLPDCRPKRFESILSVARRAQCILYDPVEQRAWMVPIISVLHHMAILRLIKDRHQIAAIYANPSWDGALAAYKALVNGRNIPVGPQNPKDPYVLQDLIEELWEGMKQIYTHQPGRRTWLLPNWIYGCELMDIVSGVPPFRLKKAPIQTSAGWAKLSKDVAVILFCRGLGEVIAARNPGVDSCPFWPSVPKGYDFLCTTISCLRELSGRSGSSENCELLVERGAWHSPDTLFEPCKCSERACCIPLQQVREASAIPFLGDWRKVKPPKGLVNAGAVIFGLKRDNLRDLSSLYMDEQSQIFQFDLQEDRLDECTTQDSGRQSGAELSDVPPTTKRIIRRRLKVENLRENIAQSIAFDHES